jgi:transposase
MTRDLRSLLSISRKLEAALAKEKRGYVRKRLLAIRAILAGKSIRQAQEIANVGRGSVDRWLRTCRQDGLNALLRERRGGRRAKLEMNPADVAPARRELANALERQPPPPLRARVVALDMLLSGRPVEQAAAAARVRPDTVQRWFRQVSRDGITPTLAKWASRKPPKALSLNADPALLRELAAREQNLRVKKRMLALALVAQGMSAHEASLRVGMGYSELLGRIRRFRQEGMAAVRDRPTRGRRKFSEAQLGELRLLVIGHPEMTVEPLCELVYVRFRVRYSIQGLRSLLQREFGIVRAVSRAHSARCFPVRSLPGRRSPPARRP